MADTALINVVTVALQSLREEISALKNFLIEQLEDLKVKRTDSSLLKDDEAEEVVRFYNCVFPGCTFQRKRCSASSAVEHLLHCPAAPPNKHACIIRSLASFAKHPRLVDSTICCYCNRRITGSRDQRSRHRNECLLV